MIEVNKKFLRESAKKEGFELQSKTVRIFQEKNLVTTQHYRVPGHSSIDVFAHSPPNDMSFNSVFVVECKGSSSDKILLLFDDSKNFIRLDEPIELSITGAIVYRPLKELRYKEGAFYYCLPNSLYKRILICANNPKDVPIFKYCISGDFRHAGSKSYGKLPRQDEKNNLFKGIKQILTALPHLKIKIGEVAASCFFQDVIVIPLIVTNTRIFVNIYEEDEPIEVDWAVHQCDGELQSIGAELIDYVFIVNVNKLRVFINEFGRYCS